MSAYALLLGWLACTTFGSSFLAFGVRSQRHRGTLDEFCGVKSTALVVEWAMVFIGAVVIATMCQDPKLVTTEKWSIGSIGLLWLLGGLIMTATTQYGGDHVPPTARPRK